MQRILIIDDQPESLELFSLLIRTFLTDVEILTETEGAAGLALAKQKQPDLLILDVKMPGMDGFEVCRRLKADPETKDIPVLMVSGVLTSTRHKVTGFTLGADGYLCKPFEPQEFIAQISSLLRMKRQSDALRMRERDLAEELDRRTGALRESEALYRHLVDALPLMVLILRSNRVVFANPAAVRGLGGDAPDRVLQHSWEEFEVEAQSPVEEGTDRRVLRYEAKWRRPDGTPLPVEVYRQAISLAGEPAEQVIGIDLSGREAAEERIRAAEERYRSLVEQLPAITYMLRLGPEPKFVFLSPQVESFLGGRVDEWLADFGLWVESIHPEDRARVLEAYEAARSTQSSESRALEYRVCGRDGRLVWFRDHSRRIGEEPGGEAILHGVLVDITGRKQAESALRQKEEQLRQSQKMEALGRLAGGVAHDFNNLLTAILGYGHLVMERIHDAEAKADLAEVLHAAERAEQLTRQLLTFSRKPCVEVEPTDLNAVVDNMERMLRRTLGEDIELVTALDEQAGLIMGESGQLEQVLMNLALNARAAMPAGGRLTITTRRVLLDEEFCRSREGLKPGFHVMLEVRDTGCGMAPEVRERVFEPFFTTKKPGEGTGIGLATVYGIVRGFGGFIEVESEPGRGATFRMWFPEVAEAPGSATRSEAVEVPGGRETVLVVEDDASVRRLTVRYLVSLGYQVLEASNSGEALLIFEQAHPPVDLVLTDIVMPRVNGIEMVRRLRQRRPDLRVLYITGYAQDVHNGAMAAQLEGAPVLLKPFDRVTLARKIRQVLGDPADPSAAPGATPAEGRQGGDA